MIYCMSAYRSWQEGRIHRGFPRLGPRSSSRMSDWPQRPPPHYRPGQHAHASTLPENRSLHVDLTTEKKIRTKINAKTQDDLVKSTFSNDNTAIDIHTNTTDSSWVKFVVCRAVTFIRAWCVHTVSVHTVYGVQTFINICSETQR